MQFTDEDFHIDLSQELYKECLERRRVFASTAIFLRARVEIKNLLCYRSSEHFLYFPLAAIHMEIVFFKMNRKCLKKTMWYSSLSSKRSVDTFMILGKLAQNLKRTSSKVKAHLYARDPEDCLIFNYEFITQVEKHYVTGTVWEVQFTDEDFQIDLSQELYEECLERTRVFASTAIFFASTSRDKKFALRAASSLESTTREQRALLIFSACSNPYGNPFL